MAAYAIFMRERMKDPAEMAVYGEKVGASREGHNLKPLAAYGDFEMLEGTPIEGAVVIEFPTFEEAKAWYNSPAYQEAVQHRFAGADYRVFIIQGL